MTERTNTNKESDACDRGAEDNDIIDSDATELTSTDQESIHVPTRDSDFLRNYCPKGSRHLTDFYLLVFCALPCLLSSDLGTTRKGSTFSKSESLLRVPMKILRLIVK